MRFARVGCCFATTHDHFSVCWNGVGENFRQIVEPQRKLWVQSGNIFVYFFGITSAHPFILRPPNRVVFACWFLGIFPQRVNLAGNCRSVNPTLPLLFCGQETIDAASVSNFVGNSRRNRQSPGGEYSTNGNSLAGKLHACPPPPVGGLSKATMHSGSMWFYVIEKLSANRFCRVLNCAYVLLVDRMDVI